MSKRTLLYQLWKNRDKVTVESAKDYVQALTRMIPLIFKGEYKPKSLVSLIIGVAAIFYTVSPIDLLPEALLGPLGFVDDFFIISYGIKMVAKEVDAFLAWENHQKDIILHGK